MMILEFGWWESSMFSHFSHVQLFVTPQPPRPLCPWEFPSKNAGVGSYFLLQGLFLTQRLNPCLLHCRWILYHEPWQAQMSMTLFKMHYKDFPAGPLVKNPPCREHGFDPWCGKFPLAFGQWSPCATTTEPMCLEPVLCKKRSHHSEAWAPQAENSPAHHN